MNIHKLDKMQPSCKSTGFYLTSEAILALPREEFSDELELSEDEDLIENPGPQRASFD